MSTLLVNTFDFEPWWTTVPATIPPARWDSMYDRSEGPTRAWLDLCDDCSVRCTFFVVGRFALRQGNLLREIVSRGHEVGCHSLEHEDVAGLTDREFDVRTREAKAILEDLCGAPVLAFRAPSFSFPPHRARTLFGILAAAGFTIDSSVCTAGRLYGGGFTHTQFAKPVNLRREFGVDMAEIPVPGVRFFGKEIQVFGGGYLRILPPHLVDALLARQAYQVLYVHPHDFDADLPDLPGSSILANFRRRARLGSLEEKIRRVFASADVVSCGQAAMGIPP